MESETTGLDEVPTKNKEAWDALYRDTPGSVWGSDPIPFVAEMVAELAPKLQASSLLLDAASGEGRHLPVLLKTSGLVYACDSSSHALSKIHEEHENVQCAQCDLESLPYEDNQFDLITLIDTIETLPDPSAGLLEMYRVLKPEGVLLCNIPGMEDEISHDGMKPVEAEESDSYLYHESYFYRFYDETEAISLLEGSGFKILRNERRTWEEAPHPGFREYHHQHTSRVFLMEK